MKILPYAEKIHSMQSCAYQAYFHGWVELAGTEKYPPHFLDLSWDWLSVRNLLLTSLVYSGSVHVIMWKRIFIIYFVLLVVMVVAVQVPTSQTQAESE